MGGQLKRDDGAARPIDGAEEKTGQDTVSISQIQTERASGMGSPLPELSGRIGHFELLGFLGRGGMGEVYKARDTRLDRTVALKLLLPGSESIHQRFQREARAQAKIQHDAVCSVFEVGVADGRPFIAMQYLRGQTLGEGATDLTLEEKVLVIRQVAEVIHLAHTQALVHRDLKPGNIMFQRVDVSLKAWVLDFGMVHVSDDGQLTSTGELLGSPCYMAPEQLSGETGAIDRRTDIYGLGTVLYEILVGRPPFEGKNVLTVLSKVATEEPTAPRQLRPDIPKDLEWITLRCLEKQPSRRYRSASGLIEDLDRFRRGEAVLARQSSWRYRWTKWMLRHRQALVAGAVALFLVLALGWRDLAQRHESRETARLTAKFLREKKELEWRLRAISMLPLHDTRPERNRLMENLHVLEEEVLAAGDIGKGPGCFALGRGYQVLGAQEKGLQYLEQAWQTGFRDPRLSFSLGLAYSKLYDKSLARLSLEPNLELRQQQRREAEAKYRDPAIARLQEAGRGRKEDSAWVAARIAAHEQRWQDALDAIEEIESSSPWFYETHGLKALVLHRQALDRVDDPTRAAVLVAEARVALSLATRIGASDPAMYIKLCYQSHTQISIFKEPLPSSPEARRELMAPCRQAIQADSGSAEAYAMAAVMAESLGAALIEQKEDLTGIDFLEETTRLATRALKLAPDQVLALQELIQANLRLAEVAVSNDLWNEYLTRATEAADRLQEIDPRSGELLFAEVARVQAARDSASSPNLQAAMGSSP